MKEKHLTRRIVQYAAGFTCMAAGVVMLKRVDWGIAPITAVPDSVANITPLTLGNATIILHAICALLQIAVQRRATLKTILTLFIGVPFGYLIDLFMWLWNPSLFLWQKCILMILGIAIQGVGVALVSGCDMMLPAPDELNNVISREHGIQLSRVKMAADAVYVGTAVAINLISTGALASVGLSSFASILLTGFFVGLTFRFFPKVKMPPFFNSTSGASSG